MPLAGYAPDNSTGGVNNNQGRPGLYAILAPQSEFGVVYHRVRKVVTDHDIVQGVEVFFIFEFGGVHADDGKLIGILGFQSLEIRNDVDAVDATVCPEIKDHYFAA